MKTLFVLLLISTSCLSQHTNSKLNETVNPGNFTTGGPPFPGTGGYQAYSSSTIGNWSPKLYGASFPNNVDAVSGRVLLPSTANVFYGGNAVSGYCVNQANTLFSGHLGNHNNCVNFFGFGSASATNSSIWGINNVIGDSAATTNTYLVGDELDIGVNGAPGNVQGIDIILSGSGTMPARAAALQFFSSGSVKWPADIIFGPGSGSYAMQIYPQSRHASANCTQINWVRYDSGDKFHPDGTLCYDSTGNFVFGQPSGGAILSDNFQANQGTACANGNVVLGPNWGTDAVVTSATGFSQTCQFIITTGSASFGANPVVTFTFPNPFPAIPICTLDVHAITGSGGAIMFDNTTPSKTAPIFTATTSTGSAFTPAASEMYKVVLRCGP